MSDNARSVRTRYAPTRGMRCVRDFHNVCITFSLPFIETIMLTYFMRLTFLFALAAPAYAAEPAGPSLLANILPLILLFVVFYFLLIRPQQRKVKQHKNMVEALKKGDEIVTSGGIYARVVAVHDASVEVQISADVVVSMQRNAVANIMPNGTVSFQKADNAIGNKKRARKTKSDDAADGDSTADNAANEANKSE